VNWHNQIICLYEEWRGLTEREGEAIQHSDWPSVSACQAAKDTLQKRIIASEEALDLCIASAQWREIEDQVRGLLSELMALEQRNSRLLAGQRQKASESQAELGAARQQLRGVQRAYGPGMNSGTWQSYS